MLGTIVNSVAILIGGLFGLLIKNLLKDTHREIIFTAVGISVLFLGISSAVPQMVKPEANPILFIVSLVIGGLLGETIGIDRHLEKMGVYLQNKFAKNDSFFSQSFVRSSIIFCVGTMAILGAIQSGIEHKHTILFTKSILDGITGMIIASSAGMGVLFSAVSVFLYQGLLTFLAQFLSGFLTADMLREISIIGGILITALGIDMLEIKKIKVVNMIPAILVPILYYAILSAFK